MVKLRDKFVEFRKRLLIARRRKAQCSEYIEGKKEVNLNNPLGFLDEEELEDDLIIPR